MSAPRRPTFCRGVTAVSDAHDVAVARRSLRPSRPRRRPSGIGAPVAISMHSPGASPRGGTWPVNTRADAPERARRRRARADVVCARSPRSRPSRRDRTAARPSVATTSRATTRPSASSSRHASRSARSAARHRRRCAAPRRRAIVEVMGLHLVVRDESARARCGRAPAGSAAPSRAGPRASEPGSRKMAQPPATPAVARDSIAAGPISWKLSIRNSSPKPSSRFSKRAVTAS